MIRINLLPKEILERRKYERFYPWVAIAALAILAIIMLVYTVLLLQVGARNRALQQDQDTAQQLQTQAQAFAVFEQKEKQLDARKMTVDTALQGRVRWGKLCNEISLVLPSEVWLAKLTGSQNTDAGPYDPQSGTYVGFPATMSFEGNTPDTDPKSMSEGYKSLAKTLVRLNDLPALYNVWLNTSVIGNYPQSSVPDEIPVQVQTFTITSGVVVPGVAATSTVTPGSTPAAPAPPSTPGQ